MTRTLTERRVVVTGMAGISPIGNDWDAIRSHLGSYRNAIVRMDEWAGYDGLNTQLAGRPLNSACPSAIPARPCAAWDG